MQRPVHIIAGRFKGRSLQSPRGQSTRPTSAKVREALFSVLAGRCEKASVLDLYAGSGALGIEALSRGAQHCIFVEQSRPALAALKGNIDTLGVEKATQVWPTRVLAALRKPPAKRVELVFADPPYAAFDPEALCDGLDAWVTTEGIVVFEHRTAIKFELPSHWECGAQKTYGDTTLSFVHKRA